MPDRFSLQFLETWLSLKLSSVLLYKNTGLVAKVGQAGSLTHLKIRCSAGCPLQGASRPTRPTKTYWVVSFDDKKIYADASRSCLCCWTTARNLPVPRARAICSPPCKLDRINAALSAGSPPKWNTPTSLPSCNVAWSQVRSSRVNAWVCSRNESGRELNSVSSEPAKQTLPL